MRSSLVRPHIHWHELHAVLAASGAHIMFVSLSFCYFTFPKVLDLCLPFDSSLSSSSIFLLCFSGSHTTLNTRAPPPFLYYIHGGVLNSPFLTSIGPSLSMPLK